MPNYGIYLQYHLIPYGYHGNHFTKQFQVSKHVDLHFLYFYHFLHFTEGIKILPQQHKNDKIPFLNYFTIIPSLQLLKNIFPLPINLIFNYCIVLAKTLALSQPLLTPPHTHTHIKTYPILIKAGGLQYIFMTTYLC